MPLATETLKPGPLASHISCVQTPGHCGVSRAFDNRPPVGKKRHLERILPELQHEGIVTDTAVGLQALAHVAQIDWAMLLVNLHRVPSAECDVRTTFSVQIRKLPPYAGPAVRPGLGGGNLGTLISPKIVGEKSPP